MHKVFVYGTLKDYDMEDGFKVSGSLYNLGAFPGIKLNGENRIPGQIILVTDEELANLDRYEGVPHLYSRVRTNAWSRESIENSPPIEVWIYEYNGNVEKTMEISKW